MWSKHTPWEELFQHQISVKSSSSSRQRSPNRGREHNTSNTNKARNWELGQAARATHQLLRGTVTATAYRGRSQYRDLQPPLSISDNFFFKLVQPYRNTLLSLNSIFLHTLRKSDKFIFVLRLKVASPHSIMQTLRYVIQTNTTHCDPPHLHRASAVLSNTEQHLISAISPTTPLMHLEVRRGYFYTWILYDKCQSYPASTTALTHRKHTQQSARTQYHLKWGP